MGPAGAQVLADVESLHLKGTAVHMRDFVRTLFQRKVTR